MAAVRLLAGHHADALARHQRAVLDIAVDHRAAQRAGPEMLDLQLRGLLVDLAAVELVDDAALGLEEALGRRIGDGAHGNDGKARIELDRGHRIARRGADEGLLEAGMGDRFGGADEARAELHAGRAHLQIAQRSPRRGRCRRRRRPARRGSRGRISCASTEVVTGPIWPPASMPSMMIASAPERTSFLARTRAGAKHISLAPPFFTRCDGAAGRQAAGEHDMAHLVLEADIDQLLELGMQGDQVDAEGPVGQRRGRGDLRSTSRSGDMEPEAMTPKPPPLEMAETRWRSDTQVMAPPMMA